MRRRTAVGYETLDDEASQQAETELVLDRGDQVDLGRGVVSIGHSRIAAIGGYRDDRNGVRKELVVAVLDRDLDHLDAVRALLRRLHGGRQGGDLQIRPIGVLEDR